MDPKVERLLKLPLKEKIALLLLLVILLGGGLTWFLIIPKHKEYTELQAKLTDLQKKLDEDRRIAADLPRFKKEFEQLELDLKQALTELPNQKEIPSLLTSITGAGKAAGLDFLIFRPRPEEPKEFYAAVPVDIVVSGSYHQIANFFATVGNLPRIVNIGNVAVSDIKQTGSRSTLRIACLATTFRFIDKSEVKKETKK
jgi:type IV pilus assembly protein PilO